MCGIAGFVRQRADQDAAELCAQAQRMAETLVHRGPDDGGVWCDESAGVALAHRRLSIIDLSPAGHQPMVSGSGRFMLVLNGEIYNFPLLRRELEAAGAAFRGHSDTEILVEAIDTWGLGTALQRCVGMFAFALWDRRERTLQLVRDRLGEKPLYYGWTPGGFVFGSELKALRAFFGWRGELNRNALALYLRHNYVPAPHCIYKNIYKLQPASVLTVRADDLGARPEASLYWDSRRVAESGVRDPDGRDRAEIIDDLDQLLRQTISEKLVADVPLGAFLSGGIDSTLVVAQMQAASSRPVKTFTIGFSEAAYNEAEAAKEVARHLGTEHTELYVTPEEAREVIPMLPGLYDEPFADSSQIPTYLVSRLARRHVTVSLSGDGGDELFGGYNRYFLGRSLWRKMRWVPAAMRGVAASAITAVNPAAWDRFFYRCRGIMPRNLRIASPGDKLHKLAEVLAVDSPGRLYRDLVSHWNDPSRLVIGGREPQTVITDSSRWAALSDFTQSMMYLDLVSYLPDDILTKVDRASMGVALEARVPLLDHRLVEFAWRLPLDMKVRGEQGKWVLRQVLQRYVPTPLIDRPKMGFGLPLDSWLRGPLREWSESLLSEHRLSSQGILDPGPVRQKWEEHLSGRRNWQYYLWDVLMFEAWAEVYV